jgi:hypothetical protein
MDAAIPWRRTAMVTGAVAAIELVALLALGAFLLGRPLGHALAHKRHTATIRLEPSSRHPVLKVPHVPVVPRLPRSHTRVLVLNGNGRSGAAGSEAATLRVHDYRISATGNAHRMDYAASLVMFRPGYAFEARRLARDVGIRVVGPLDGLRTRDLKGSQLVVVVGD